MNETVLKIFRESFENLVSKGKLPSLPKILPKKLMAPNGGVYAAAFEKIGRNPRGRVGNYMPLKPTLADEIQYQAKNLSESFPFRREDLPFLTYELLLTQSPHFLTDIHDLNPYNGLLIKTRTKTAVSLPLKESESKRRFKEACIRAQIDYKSEEIRLYEFPIEIIQESK